MIDDTVDLQVQNSWFVYTTVRAMHRKWQGWTKAMQYASSSQPQSIICLRPSDIFPVSCPGVDRIRQGSCALVQISNVFAVEGEAVASFELVKNGNRLVLRRIIIG